MKSWRKKRTIQRKSEDPNYFAESLERLKHYNAQWKAKDPEGFHLKQTEKWKRFLRERPGYDAARYLRKKEKDPESLLRRNKVKHRNARKRLLGGYVRSLLTRGTVLSTRDLPQELVELKRANLLVHRAINKEENGEV